MNETGNVCNRYVFDFGVMRITLKAYGNATPEDTRLCFKLKKQRYESGVPYLGGSNLYTWPTFKTPGKTITIIVVLASWKRCKIPQCRLIRLMAVKNESNATTTITCLHGYIWTKDLVFVQRLRPFTLGREQQGHLSPGRPISIQAKHRFRFDITF